MPTEPVHPWRRQAGSEPCSSPRCEQCNALACAYVDGSGAQCATAWCAEHRDSVDRVTYCRRHAGLIRSLTPALLSDLPALGNRAPSLVIWVGRLIDHDLRFLLTHALGEGARVAQQRVVLERRDAACVWVLRWIATGSASSLEVSVEVSEDADCIVMLRCGESLLFSAEPPWITARLQGNPLSDPHLRAARSLFSADLLAALDQHVTGTRSHSAAG